MIKVSFENVSLGYEGKAIAENINFSVKDGEYFFITGENGSGKTTLMKALLGQIIPQKGKIVLNSNKIGYLPQSQLVQNDFPASVREIILSGCLGKNAGLRPFYLKREKKKAYDAAEKLGITDILSRSFFELSGGQKQKVLLARALCSAEDVLLLDEPVSGLDPESCEEMYNIVENLNKSGMTVIMISHDMKAVYKYAHNVFNMDKGDLK